MIHSLIITCLEKGKIIVHSICLSLVLTPLSPIIASQGAAAAINPSAVTEKAIDGQLISFGTVTVNDRRALNGSTIQNDSDISVPCGPGNSAIVKIGNLGLVEIRPGSRIRLKFDSNTIGGELVDGTVRIRTRAGVVLDLDTPDGPVKSAVKSADKSDGEKAAYFPVRVSGSSGCTFDQQAVINNTTPNAVQSGAAAGAATGSSGLSPLALAALIFSVGVAAAVTIVALTDSGSQVSPTNP